MRKNYWYVILLALAFTACQRPTRIKRAPIRPIRIQTQLEKQSNEIDAGAFDTDEEDMLEARSKTWVDYLPPVIRDHMTAIGGVAVLAGGAVAGYYYLRYILSPIGSTSLGTVDKEIVEATLAGDIETVGELVKTDHFDPRATTAEGENYAAIAFAADAPPPIINIFTGAGVSLNHLDQAGHPPWMLAQNLPALHAAIEGGADFAHQPIITRIIYAKGLSSPTKAQMIEYAVREGHAELSDPSAPGLSETWDAVNAREPQALRALLGLGAKLKRHPNGNTELMFLLVPVPDRPFDSVSLELIDVILASASADKAYLESTKEGTGITAISLARKHPSPLARTVVERLEAAMSARGAVEPLALPSPTRMERAKKLGQLGRQWLQGKPWEIFFRR